MKLNFGKKLVLFVHWLLSLFGCALAVMLVFFPETVKSVFASADQLLKGWADIAAFVVLGLYAVFAVASVVIIFSGKKKNADRGFITVDSSEAGRTRIAIGAVDQMIRQAVRGVEGILEMKSGIVNNEDSISINAAVTIVSGAHVPTVTMNMQRAIRSYIELNCGVAVREVSVSVNAMQNAEDAKNSKRRGGNVSAASAVPAAPIMPVAEAEPVVEEAIPEEPESEEITLTLDPPAPEAEAAQEEEKSE